MTNIQLFSTAGCKLPPDPPCKRAVIGVGSLCNYRCEFCYFKYDLKSSISLDEIKAKIDRMYEYGFREFDLTGGEPSIRKDFFDILDYCNQRGTVSCLSNGYKFADLEFCREAQKHGLNEVLFSLHGSNVEQHDHIVGHKGAFKRIIQAIKNCKALGYRVRLNCTVHEGNASTLNTEYTDLVNELDVFEVNFICVNYFDNNRDYKSQSLKIITDAIKGAIDRLNCKLINVRYVPYCYMQGYEKYVTGYYQLIYDIYDWNLTSYRHKERLPSKSDFIKDQAHDAKNMRTQGFHKGPECKACQWYFICDGIKHGMNDPYKPVKGKWINDVLYYRHDFFKLSGRGVNLVH